MDSGPSANQTPDHKYNSSTLNNNSVHQHQAAQLNKLQRRRNFAQSQSQSRSLEGTLNEPDSDNEDKNSYSSRPFEFSPEIMEAADKVTYITSHIKSENYYEEVIRTYLLFQKFKIKFIFKSKFKLFFFSRCAKTGNMLHW